MKTLKIEFQFPPSLLYAMLYSDTSGLGVAEIEAIDGLEEDAHDLTRIHGGTHYCWKCDDFEERTFRPDHDAGQLGGADCVDVTLVIFLGD